MTEEERQTMAVHGITCETKTVFSYKGYTYDRLEDAVRYARIESRRD